MRALAERTDLIATDRLAYDVGLAAKMTQRDLLVTRRVQNTDASHVVCGFEQRLGQATRIIGSKRWPISLTSRSCRKRSYERYDRPYCCRTKVSRICGFVDGLAAPAAGPRSTSGRRPTGTPWWPRRRVCSFDRRRCKVRPSSTVTANLM